MNKLSKKKSSGDKPRRGISIIFLVAVTFFSALLIANMLTIAAEIKEKNEKYAALEEMYEEELLIKSEYEYLLDDENRLEYIERIAREKYGYVAPGERAFYDSSYGK